VAVITEARARSPWRLRLVFDAIPGGATTAASYTLTREDGAGTSAEVARAFAVDATAVELALSEALRDHVTYQVALAGVADPAAVRYSPPLAQILGADRQDDPEAEAFGVDSDWLAERLSGDGDVPEVRGLPCLRHDLIAVARTVPGEVYHRPDCGAGIPTRVNGPAPLSELAAAAKREWLKDDRVKRASPKVTESSAGEISIRGDVQSVALDDALPLTSRG
jgi:hypothetical protein